MNAGGDGGDGRLRRCGLRRGKSNESIINGPILIYHELKLGHQNFSPGIEDREEQIKLGYFLHPFWANSSTSCTTFFFFFFLRASCATLSLYLFLFFFSLEYIA